MALFAWKQSYATGVQRFDEEHKLLVTMINDLHDAMIAGKGEDVLGGIFDGLRDYVRRHFRNEETLFRIHGYPYAEPHAEVHRKLESKVDALRADIMAGKKGMALKTFKFLREWLVTHIQKHDQAYGVFFNAKGVK